MAMIVETMIRVVKLDDDASRWGLYSSVENAEDAAKSLNAAFIEAVHSGNNPVETEALMQLVMTRYAVFGADDPEAQKHLRLRVEQAYGMRQDEGESQ